MSLNNPYQQYQHNSVFTARPEELTLMLYNGAIKFLKQAKISIEKADVEKTHKNITRAQDIIIELMSSLDLQYDVSHNLFSLYDFMNYWLTQANIHKFDGGTQKIDDVIKLIEDLRETWTEAMKTSKMSQQKSG
jgi:flagellar secretion chaperone FliS